MGKKKAKRKSASKDQAGMIGGGAAEASVEVRPSRARNYEAELRMLQVELVKLQRHFIGCGDKILVVLEGRAPPARMAASSASSNI